MVCVTIELAYTESVVVNFTRSSKLVNFDSLLELDK